MVNAVAGADAQHHAKRSREHVETGRHKTSRVRSPAHHWWARIAAWLCSKKVWSMACIRRGGQPWATAERIIGGPGVAQEPLLRQARSRKSLPLRAQPPSESDGTAHACAYLVDLTNITQSVIWSKPYALATDARYIESPCGRSTYRLCRPDGPPVGSGDNSWEHTNANRLSPRVVS